MIEASVRGRLGKTPVERKTKDGKVWATASVAVNMARYGQDEETEWINLAAFGKAAEVLLKHQSGEPVNVFGPMTRQSYTGRDGIERTSWQIQVASILSARTTRPSGKRKRPADKKASAPTGMPERPRDTDEPFFDDEIPL